MLSAAVFTAACSKNQDKTSETLANNSSTNIESDHMNGSSSYNIDNNLDKKEVSLDNIPIINKSNVDIFEGKDFDYRTFYLAEEGLTLEQAVYLNGKFYYMLGKINDMAQFSSSFELYSYNIDTDEKEKLYSYNGSQYYQLVAFENELFWIVADNTSKIIRYNLLANSAEVFKETNAFINLNTSKTHLIWDEFNHDGNVKTYIYNTEAKEISEIVINNRYINSPYYGINLIDDMIVYPVLENDIYYMIGVNIDESGKEVLRVKLPSKVASYSAYNQNFIWTTDFSSPNNLFYLYDINKNCFYVLNKQGEEIFVPRITDNYVVWTKSTDNNIYLLELNEWVKYTIPVNEFTNVYISSNGEIYTIGNSTCGVFLV